MMRRFEDNALLKSDTGRWYMSYDGEAHRLIMPRRYDSPLDHLEKAYYSADEVKAKGMQWVTIRGTHVLIKPLAEGGYAVVGGAGGALNHMKIDKIASEADYKSKEKKKAEKKKEDLKDLTPEEIHEQAVKKKESNIAKKKVRESYTEKIGDILGVTKEELREQISAKDMDELANKARDMVEARAKVSKDFEADVDAQLEKEVQKEVVKKVKDIERQALDSLMNDYAKDDPNAKYSLKQLLDKDKAVEVLTARKEYRKLMKEIGKGEADISTDLKVGDVFAGVSSGDHAAIEAEIEAQKATENNIALYDKFNAQSEAVKKYRDQGAVSALNGLLGDVYGIGGTFSTDTVENIGLEAVVRAVTIKIQQDGMADTVKKALNEYAAKERQKVVKEALKESGERFENADNLRALARDTDDAEAILSMASANGHALKQIVAGQRALGTAVGSLRAVAHMINALEDPPADVVQVDMGKDLSRARDRAKKAGLPKGSYAIKTQKEGRSKRLVMEIKKDNLNTFFQRNEEMRGEADKISKIKSYKENDGYKPPGIKESIKLDPAQEAGLRFFNEQGKVLLDFEAGLGKTAVGYAAAMEMIHNKGVKKVLMVVPATLRDQMHQERKVFLDEENQNTVSHTRGKGPAARKKIYEKENGIVIIGHDQLRTDGAMLKDMGFGGVIMDEIHQMTAGTGDAGRYKGMMDLQDIEYKIGMSGTNIKNKKEEVYRKINWLDKDHSLGSKSDFDKRYKGLNQGTGMLGDSATEGFRKETADYIFTQKNNLEVKNNQEKFTVPLSADQRSRYAASERKYREERAAKKPGAAARRDSRNYSIVTNGGSAHNAKVNKIIDTMETKHPDEKAVVHVTGLNAMRTAKTALENKFGKGAAVEIFSGTSAADITKFKAAFNDPDNPLRFIVGSSSLESGHNLQTGGTVTFHLDQPDTYAAVEQREKRVHRKGQTRDTHSYTLSGNSPLDLRKEDILKTKRKEMGIIGNPKEVENMDDSGFLGMLNKYEREARGEATA